MKLSEYQTIMWTIAAAVVILVAAFFYAVMAHAQQLPPIAVKQGQNLMLPIVGSTPVPTPTPNPVQVHVYPTANGWSVGGSNDKGGWVNLTEDGVFVGSSPKGAQWAWTGAIPPGTHTLQVDGWRSGGIHDGTATTTVSVPSPSPTPSPQPSPSQTPTGTPTPAPTPSPSPTSSPSPTPVPSPVALGCPAYSTGTTYYVSQSSGDDANAGTDPSHPWASVDKVMAQQSTFKGGDQVRFERGDAWGEEWDVAMAGTPGNPICVSNYGDPSQPAPLFDEQGQHQWCIAAVSPVPDKPVNTKPPLAKYLTIDGFECEHATKMGIGVINKAPGYPSSIPGIVLSRNYVHNTGAGAYGTTGQAIGTDDGGYNNQLVCRDDSGSPDGCQLLYNTVRWCGGHNCFELHGDTGGPRVIGNIVGPGSPHEVLDIKMAGAPSSPAIVDSNTVVCGNSLFPNLGGQAGVYFENVNNPHASVVFTNNTTADCGIGAQISSGWSAGYQCQHARCDTDAVYHNNKFSGAQQGFVASNYGNNGQPSVGQLNLTLATDNSINGSISTDGAVMVPMTSVPKHKPFTRKYIR